MARIGFGSWQRWTGPRKCRGVLGPAGRADGRPTDDWGRRGQRHEHVSDGRGRTLHSPLSTRDSRGGKLGFGNLQGWAGGGKERAVAWKTCVSSQKPISCVYIGGINHTAIIHAMSSSRMSRARADSSV